MLHFIYTQPLSRVIIIMAIAIAIWGYARTKLYGKRWNIANTGNLEVGHLSSVDFSADRKGSQLP